ncbi:Uncharacterized membrane protein [Pedobacter steynii]|uniref:Uncharacterized membrane protein n=1 Tax=Pedobacter steynii TaxID=430522 RepID=A0A1H0GFB9_9SPHI|nr:anthrone oxygenase family protein [Pedobacter steynii]NQX42406.1 DUF1772 domain-containing protein [Pedobacter steynii]SDO05544.1 Uncharacterized membrane protein [Pedobacter steynii]
MIRYSSLLLALATITTALMAGLFYAFSVSINLAFRHLPDTQYLLAMQEINKAIVNPVFLFSFLGSPLFLVLATLAYRRQTGSPKFGWIFAASVIFIVGSFGVTIVGNIPLNNQLDGFSLQGSSLEQAKMMREAFAGPWNNWHTIRTICSVCPLVLLVIACLRKG